LAECCSASTVIGCEPIERQLTVGLQPVKHIRRENSGLTDLSGSFSISATHTLCPFRPSGFLQTGQSAKPRFFELECHKAAVADLTLPAITSPRQFSTKLPLILRRQPKAALVAGVAIISIEGRL
jgi:hypothetical protein